MAKAISTVFFLIYLISTALAIVAVHEWIANLLIRNGLCEPFYWYGFSNVICSGRYFILQVGSSLISLVVLPGVAAFIYLYFSTYKRRKQLKLLSKNYSDTSGFEANLKSYYRELNAKQPQKQKER